MKLLFVIHGLRSGGAEKVLTMLANHLSTKEYDINILVFNDDEPFYPLNSNINLFHLNSKIIRKGIIPKINFVYSRIKQQKDIFRKINPDVIISFITLMNNLSIIAAKLANKPIIVSEHTNHKRFYKKPLGIVRRFLYPFANEVVILTKFDKNYYKSFIKNLHVIKNPLVLENKHSLINKTNIILAVGTLYHLKGFDLLIHAYSKLKNKDWKLIIVGEGKDRKYLEQLIEKLGLTSNIEMVGVQKNVEQYYKQASIFVLSSRAEGFPGALCEGMGYGCASIAFDCISGPNEIIKHNYNGLLVESNNINKLSEAIDFLIENEAKRDLFSSNGIKIKETLSIDKISFKWIEIIEKFRKNVNDI